MSSELVKGLVSTIIPVFNRPGMIVEAVDSVLAQTYRPIEIIIVDDGSNDTTPAVLKNLASQYDAITVLSQSNSGPGVARETGRKQAAGEYIQYLDSDDLLLPEKFSLQVAELVNKPSADVVYGKTEVLAVGAEPRQIADRKTGEEIEAMFPLFLRERWWFTSTPLYRRRVSDQAGAWSIATNEEDWEYDCRIAKTGGVLAYTNNFVSLHRQHDSHISNDGSVSVTKLRQRAASRIKIYQHAKEYAQLASAPSQIEYSDWHHFSQYAFLLARQCAAAGLTSEPKQLIALSVEAVGKPSFQHRVFSGLSFILGMSKAAKLIQLLGR